MTAPGIGPLIASATVAAIGNGAAFAKGRDFAAWLGLVPKQVSTGDRTILGRISKRGNRYLRTLIMQRARVILLRPANWAKHYLGLWLTAAAQRLPRNDTAPFRTTNTVRLVQECPVLMLVAFDDFTRNRRTDQINKFRSASHDGLSVRDPDEGSFKCRVRRLIGGSKTRGRCRRGFPR